MRFKNPIESNKCEIIQVLMQTLQNRRTWILTENPTISQIFNTYPRLLDYNGEMVNYFLSIEKKNINKMQT